MQSMVPKMYFNFMGLLNYEIPVHKELFGL